MILWFVPMMMQYQLQGNAGPIPPCPEALVCSGYDQGIAAGLE